jgi:hypothetical protein
VLEIFKSTISKMEKKEQPEPKSKTSIQIRHEDLEFGSEDLISITIERRSITKPSSPSEIRQNDQSKFESIKPLSETNPDPEPGDNNSNPKPSSSDTFEQIARSFASKDVLVDLLKIFLDSTTESS